MEPNAWESKRLQARFARYDQRLQVTTIVGRTNFVACELHVYAGVGRLNYFILPYIKYAREAKKIDQYPVGRTKVKQQKKKNKWRALHVMPTLSSHALLIAFRVTKPPSFMLRLDDYGFHSHFPIVPTIFSSFRYAGLFPSCF